MVSPPNGKKIAAGDAVAQGQRQSDSKREWAAVAQNPESGNQLKQW